MTINHGAFHTGQYTNVFKQYGYSESDIASRVAQTFEDVFYGDDVHVCHAGPVG